MPKSKENRSKWTGNMKQLPAKATNAFEMAQTSGNFFLAGAGFGAGLFMNAGKQMKTLFFKSPSKLQKQESSTPSENDEEKHRYFFIEETGAPTR